MKITGQISKLIDRPKKTHYSPHTRDYVQFSISTKDGYTLYVQLSEQQHSNM